jgi:hypothetical protein
MLKLLTLLISTASAQPAQSPPSPQQQAIAQKLMDEINSGIQLRAELLAAQQQIKELQDKKCDAKPSAPSGH